MTRINKALLIIVALITSLAMSPDMHDHKNDMHQPKQFYVATYYADKFNGRKTSTGDVFHNDSLSVATSESKFYKKMITFRSAKTNRTIKLYCNDKMNPRMKGSVHFDLSKKAMKYLSGVKSEKKIPGKIQLYVLKTS